MELTVRIAAEDNVCVALTALSAGTEVSGVTLKTDVPAGHKIALTDIPQGARVIKYGFPIGYATEDIPAGSHIHVHNLKTLLGDELSYTYTPAVYPMPEKKEGTFMGYPRKDRRAGIRNEIWIVPTVGCVNDVAKALEAEAQCLVGGGVEAVVSFHHPYGCSQMGDDQENTRQILADMVMHPNAGGVLLLGLGCENSGIAEVMKHMPACDEKRFRTLISQQSEDEIEDGMKLLRELADNMRNEQRVPCSCDQLVVGLKCGGSDGFSGITANPVIGGFSDLLVSMGGSTILTEVPEMFGAETILMARCINEEVFDKTVNLINGFKHYFTEHHQTIYENPSPGNKAGGITTLEEKALGCTQKSGFAPVEEVLAYAEPLKKPGLNLLYAPGNDLVAATSLACSGAQIVLFSTGRGTPFACPVPTMKIASNTPLAQKKKNWIDFDAGRLLSGMTLPQLAQELLDKVLATASGEKVCSEKAGFRDMAIFKNGVTL